MEDLYKNLQPSRDEYFDTSDYPSDHFLYSRVNTKVLGKMNDECAGKPAVKYVGFRSKMYSLLLNKHDDDETVEMTAKGKKRNCITKCMRHSMRVEALRSRKCT